MKKRILAMLLALVMVVSLLPMSVMAAETTCPGEGEDHTLANCPNPVEVDVVEPTGCTWGYTVYDCGDCGERFADVFKEPAGEHELEETKAPACEVEGLKECKNCDYSEKIPALEHDWADQTVEEGKCYVIKVCTLCGEKQKIAEDHVWSEHPTSIVAPNGCKDGVATYTCKNCDATHEVKVLAEEGHKLVDVAVVPATCTEDGVEAHQKCEVCETLFLNGDEVEAEDLVIPAAHTPETVETVLTPCKTLVQKICSVCDEVLSEETVEQHPEEELYTIAESDPTCTTYGHTLKGCKRCGAILETEIKNPLGHKWQAPDKPTVKPRCETEGEGVWTCTVCQATETRKIPALGHALKTVYIAPTCARYGFWITYCANHVDCKSCTDENCVDCDFENLGYVRYLNADLNGDGVEEEIPVATVLNNADGYKSPNGFVKVHKFVVDTESGFDKDNHTEDPAKTEIINPAPNCEGTGDKLWYCLDCDYWEVTTYVPGHDYDLDNDGEDDYVLVAPTCLKPGAKVYTCEVCQKVLSVVDAPALGHDLMEEVHTVDPTCINQGYDWQQCQNACCDLPDGKVKDNDSFVPTVKYEMGKTWFDSYEDMIKIHEHVDAGVNYRKGDCLTIGLDKYYCSDCATYILVVTDNTGKGHVMPAGTVVVDATCTTDGYIAEYVCESCRETVEKEILPATGHKMTPSEEVPATCEKDGVKAYFHCETCDKNFVMDEDEKYVEVADADLIIPALKHNYVVIDKRSVDCELYGYIHVLCANCGDEFIHKYVKETGHFMIGERREPTCTEDGYQNDYCVNPGCKHKVEQVLKAEGHTNEAGEHFWGFCTDTVTDNICVVCGEVKPVHKNIVINSVPATCKDYAYTIKYCPDCDYYVVEEDTISGLGDCTWEGRGLDGWTTKVPATYHEGGVEERTCIVCGKYETRDTDPLLGMGLNMYVENAAVAGAAICDSSLVKITVTVDANNIDAWGYDFIVNYDADVLVFEYADFSNSIFNVNATYTDAEKAEGAVRVTANVANFEGGRIQNVNINEEMVLVDLYFRVTNEGEGETALNIYTARFIDKTGADCVETVAQAMVEIEIDEFLDFNNDGEFDIVDCQAAYKILIGEELLVGIDEEGNEIYELVTYDATIDVDKDGAITAVDIQMLYDLLVGNNDYEDMTDCRAEE